MHELTEFLIHIWYMAVVNFDDSFLQYTVFPVQYPAVCEFYVRGASRL